jgi:hypothetical protein
MSSTKKIFTNPPIYTETPTHSKLTQGTTTTVQSKIQIRIKNPPNLQNAIKVTQNKFSHNYKSSALGDFHKLSTQYTRLKDFSQLKSHHKNSSIDKVFNAKSQPSSPNDKSKAISPFNVDDSQNFFSSDFKQSLKMQLNTLSKMNCHENTQNFVDSLSDLLLVLFAHIACIDSTLTKPMDLLSEYVKQLNLIVQNTCSKFDNANALLQLQKVTFENNELKKKLQSKKQKLKEIKSISHQTTIILNDSQKNISNQSGSFKIINQHFKGTEPNSPSLRNQFDPSTGTDRSKRFSIPKLDMAKLEKYKKEHRLIDYNKEVKESSNNDSQWVFKQHNLG